MSMLLVALLLTPIIYLGIALVLVLLPFERQVPGASLNFNALELSTLPNTNVGAHYFNPRDGSSLFFRKLPGQANLLILLLHGSGSEGRYLIPLASRLNKSLAATVVIPDLRGHGESTPGNLGDINYIGQLEDDLLDLKNQLAAEYPEALMILGGHSSGAGLAVRYAGSQLPPFDGYILLAPYLGFKAPTVRPNSGDWVQVSIRRYAGLTMLNKVGIKTFNSRPVIYFNRPENLADGLQANAYSYRLNESISPRAYQTDLRAIQQPVITIVGKDDEALLADQFEAVFKQFAPQTSLHLLANTQHLDLPTRQETSELLSTWLRNLTDASPDEPTA